MTEQLISDFTENYMEKIFYFCLKKTGKGTEAEELTQDISLNVLSGLKKGTIPANFSAWVWQIVRNRYSVWADKKHRRSELIVASDIGDYEIEDKRESILDELIWDEQLALLRRELAFVQSEYRNVLVAYYIENQSIRDIAANLSITPDAVKKRLQRARNILKEGMNMAREFGVRSYKPEEITFTNSCTSFGDYGQPWAILNHALYKNIFLQCYGNPSTAEEVSLELGVALPYMEDELKFLTEKTFLIKKKDKYETYFPIISKKVQEKIWNYNNRVTEKITYLLEKLVDDFSRACENHKIHYYGKYQTYEDAKWTLLMIFFDQFMKEPLQNKKFEYTKRPDNGKWDIVGYENADLPRLPHVSLHGCDYSRIDKPAVHFQQYKFGHGGIEWNTPVSISHEEALNLKAVVEGKWDECEKVFLDSLLNYGYIRKTADGYAPTIGIFGGVNELSDMDQYFLLFSDAEKETILQTMEEIRGILSDITAYSHRVTLDDLPALFKNDERMCAFACRCSALGRSEILEQAIADGWLKYDENTSKVIGACLYL